MSIDKNTYNTILGLTEYFYKEYKTEDNPEDFDVMTLNFIIFSLYNYGDDNTIFKEIFVDNEKWLVKSNVVPAPIPSHYNSTIPIGITEQAIITNQNITFILEFCSGPRCSYKVKYLNENNKEIFEKICKTIIKLYEEKYINDK